jgi:predicted short-subunit dehydrogenase-like oxidoreductase (DUF2520 family)
MFDSVNVIGRGRAGSAIAARLEQHGIALRENAELHLLCVPDSAIAAVARGLAPGHGWVAHVSGAAPLAALDPHTRRFGLHPLQTFTRARGPEQLYRAVAAIASNYLVTLHRVASELFRAAGAPPEALVPLMRRTIDNGFELTGPIERGDWETVEAHREAIRATRPYLEPLYDVLAEATRA